MDKAMEVGRCIGTYEVNEETALLKHHGRKQGKTENQSMEGIECSARMINLTLKVLEGEPLKVHERGTWLLRASCRVWKNTAGHVCPVLIPGLSFKPVAPAPAFASSQRLIFSTFI